MQSVDLQSDSVRNPDTSLAVASSNGEVVD